MTKQCSLYYNLLFLLLILLQIVDGLLTAHGIALAGSLDVEGNPLVKYLMQYYGAYFGLFLVKVVACIVIGFVYIIVQRTNDGLTKITKVGLHIALYFYIYTACAWVYLIGSNNL